jgi:DNA-binding NtrC family response regulator
VRKPERRLSFQKRSAETTARRDEAFRVLVVAHRPRYRSRMERAVKNPEWETRSLLNREDPIGMIQQKPPHLLIISVDAAENRNIGYLRAAQPFRPQVKIIAVFETREEADELAQMSDIAIAPPWRTADIAQAAQQICAQFQAQQTSEE